MFLVVDIILSVIALGLLVPIAVLFIECIAALLPGRTESWVKSVPRPRIAVLVPAHNEAAGIGTTLETILPQLTDQDRLIVIADNCTDETATIAKHCCESQIALLANVGIAQEQVLSERTLDAIAPAGTHTKTVPKAIVIERQDPDPERRGKGYALDYGLRSIEADPPDVVVMVDADCIVQQGTIERIASLAASVARPVQATYLMEQPANPGPKDSISALAFMVKNLVRPSGLAQLRLPCLLTGTGMAFPWSAIAKATLASGNIVEDMQLAIDLAIAGLAPVFEQEAKVIGRLPQQEQAAQSQRTRWEHGHLQTLLTQVPKLFKAAVVKGRFDLLAFALDLCIPPLSLLVMIWVVCMGGALLAGTLGASWMPSIFLAIEGQLIFISIASAWAKFGREDFPVQTLLSVPFYILWKIPLYLAFIIRRQKKWVRTERDAVETSES
ncbi:glycosyltransferase family 2 protein [Allocoleopsis franciscana]|uniref:Glycosyl transferase n=1 Tax=Allocoleopsis franciscana PCC 7113 TaxID=1173027 RepID=K9WP17_9CYAN|nr:glycosyltransferase [Allocoleopsis franciscana]AFZ22120.1 glycosyl transferase [Allocoleopsis franciscana PCC 7113]